MVRTNKATLRKFVSTPGHVKVNTKRLCPGPEYASGQTSKFLNPKLHAEDPTAASVATPPTHTLLSKMSTELHSPAMSTISAQLSSYPSFPLDPALMASNGVDMTSLNDTPEVLNENNTVVLPSLRTFNSSQELNMVSYEVRDEIQRQYVSDTTTRRHYEKYLKDYTDWWDGNEFRLMQQNPARSSIAALPITPAKVVLFLEYTMKRPRRAPGGLEIPGTTVGRATVQGIINALEWQRSRHVHLHPDNDDTKINLRSDDRIKRIESAAKHNEPFRIALAQTRKAAGTSADTYTQEEMTEISLTCLNLPDTRREFMIAIRDRALYLLPLCTAFRGDNIRSLSLSDLFSKPVLNVGVGKRKIMCLRILCDNAKHNQSGKVEEQGAIRHRLVELCSIGALALHFFVQFHLVENPTYNNWTADFSAASQEAGYGIHGYREWQQYKVFPGDGKTKPMTYQNHANRIHHLHKQAGNINLSKVTHAQRYTTAFLMRSHGAHKEEARAMGWSCGDSYNSVYDRELPIEALLGAAMYDARKPDTHFCARALLEPPPEVTSQIFPWIEHELEQLKVRAHANHLARDMALEGFFGLLVEMRTILVQDLAVLCARMPKSYIYSCPPFNTSQFREFAANASALIKQSEEEAQLALGRLPETVAQSFQGALQHLYGKQQESEERSKQNMRVIFEEEFAKWKAEVEFHSYGEPPNKRRKRNPKKSALTDMGENTNLSTQPIRSMFTAPPIATSTFSQSQVDWEEPVNGYDGEQPFTVVTRPPHVIGSVSTTFSTISEALQTSQEPDTVSLPKLGPNSYSYPRDVWWSNWLQLTGHYNMDQLLKHTWDWEQNHLVPHYDFQKISTFDDLWKEYTEGLNGHLPFREIKERWAANPAWHRNEGGKKNEFTRRKKTVDLIETLSKRPHWSIPISLKFLTEGYGKKVIGTFMRELNKDLSGKILEEATKYC